MGRLVRDGRTTDSEEIRTPRRQADTAIILLRDGNPVNLIAKVTDELPNAPPMSTGEGCEMKLGVDFLRRFLTIFDFAQQDVLLFTYG